MTNQRDPNRPMTNRTDRDEGWGMLPILLAIAVVLAAGYMLYRNYDHAGPGTTRTTQTQPNVTAPSSAPTAPTTPKQP
jgi:hypothetical protein